MPLVRISVPHSTATKDIEAVSSAVHQALVAHCTVPLADKFHLVQRHAQDELICSPEFLGVKHTSHVVMVQIFLSIGRSLVAKKALYATFVGTLEPPVTQKIFALLGLDTQPPPRGRGARGGTRFRRLSRSGAWASWYPCGPCLFPETCAASPSCCAPWPCSPAWTRCSRCSRVTIPRPR